MKEEFELIAKTFQGLEEVLAKELTELGASNIEVARGPQREDQGRRRHRQFAGRGGFHQSGGFPSGHQPHREGRKGHGKIKGGYYGNAA